MRALYGFLIACLALGSAHANPLRMHGLPVGSGPAPDLIVQMLPTQTAILDLTTVTTHCNNTELMSVTPVGTGATFEVDRGQQLIASTTETWRKSELVANTGYSADSDNQALNVVHTTGTAVGTGAATLNILCSSSGLTKVVRIDVVAGPQVDWNYGVETSVRFGGYPLSLLPGPVTRYTLDAAFTSTWEIWGQGTPHLMIKCVAGGGVCQPETQTGTPYATGATSNAFTPTAGISQDILLHDSSGPDVTIHMHYIAHERDVAVTPTGSGWAPVNTWQAQTCLMTSVATHYGDVVMHEGMRALRGVYGPMNYPSTPCDRGGTPPIGAKTQYTTPTLGPVPEFAVSGFTCSVALNHCFMRPYSPAFVTFTCREPYECDYGMLVKVERENAPVGFRWTQFNTRNVSGAQGVYPYAFNGFQTIDFQVDHLKADTITTFVAAANGSYAYFLDNFASDGSAGSQFAFCNSIVAGNRVLRPSQGDAFHLGIQACNDGSEGDTYPSFSWNWVNGLWINIFNHLDFAQGDWSIAGLKTPLGNNIVYKVVGNILNGAPFKTYDCGTVYTTGTPGTFSPTSCSGNANFFGQFNSTNCANGICANGTYRSEDGQAFLMHDGTESGATVQYRVYGNYAASVFGQGINMTTAGPGSVVSYNAFFFSNKLSNLNLLPNPYNSPTIINFGAGALFTADGNIVTENNIQWIDTGAFPSPGIDTPPLVSNLDSTNGCSAVLSCFSNAKYTGYGDTADFADRMQPNIDAFVLAGPAVAHGPAQVVDIRGRKVTNPTAVQPHSNIPLTLPYCSAAPVVQHTGSGQAVGDTFSLVTPVTWTLATGTKQSQWVVQWISGGSFHATAVSGPSVTTNTTYTLQTPDFAHAPDTGTNVSIYYQEYSGAVSAGSNTCQTALFTIQTG